jgi:hypothetical protein
MLSEGNSVADAAIIRRINSESNDTILREVRTWLTRLEMQLNAWADTGSGITSSTKRKASRFSNLKLSTEFLSLFLAATNVRTDIRFTHSTPP